MTAVQVLAAAGALLVVSGVWCTAAYAAAWQPPARQHSGRRGSMVRRHRVPLAAAAAGATAWVVTGWPALAVGAAAGALGLPAMVRDSGQETQRIGRVEGVEEWSRRLADVIAIGVGLEQAMQTSARSAPRAIESEVRTLAARLAARMPTEDALRRFADDLDDPAADLVVAALILAARRRGPGAAAALTGIADSVAEEVSARRRVEADRAKPRTTARAVSVITVVIAAAGVLNRTYAYPYGSTLGQIVLVAILSLFATALWWLHAMTQVAVPPRIIGPAGQRP